MTFPVTAVPCNAWRTCCPACTATCAAGPGTLFLGSLEDEAVLLPFSFNALAEQNFVLVLSGNGLSIADIHGFDPQEGSIPRLSTPYEARHLLEICAAQVGDTVYLAHTAYSLHKLVRSTDSEPRIPPAGKCHPQPRVPLDAGSRGPQQQPARSPSPQLYVRTRQQRR